MERVKFLTDKEHQNPLQKDEYGDTALHAAAQGGSLDILKYFINERNCNPACLGYRGRTPLHDASDCAHLDVVKYLVTEQQVHCKNKCVILAKYFATTIVRDYPSLHKLV